MTWVIRWFSPGTPVSSTTYDWANRTWHDIPEKVMVNEISIGKLSDGEATYSTDIKFLHQSTGRLPMPGCKNTQANMSKE